MNNGLGINFLRYVCEEDLSSWSQVFARVPFDEVEISQKGALFGVVRGVEMENWADTEVEITNWVEEYFNGVEKGGDLASFSNDFYNKYPKVSCLWVWILEELGVRKIKVTGQQGGNVKLKRSGVMIDLSGNLQQNKVVLGELKEGDEVWMWLGGLGDEFEKWGDIAKEGVVGSFGAFKITVDGLEKKSVDDSPVIVEIVKTDDEPTQEAVEELPVAEVMGGVKVFDKESLVKDRFVGPVGLRLKLVNWWMGRRKLRVEGESGSTSSKKWSLFVGVVFLILLAVSLFFGSIRKNGVENEKKWLSFSEPIGKNLSEAVSLTKLNPAGGKKIVEDTRIMFNSRKSEFENDEYKVKVEALGKSIEETWTIVSGEKEGQIAEVVNLGLIRSGVNANRISSVSENKFVVIDSVSGLVMSVDTKTKEIKVVAGKGGGLGWLDSVSDGNKYFVMSKGSVFVVGNEASPLTFDTAVVDPLKILRFGTSVYVLEKENKEIFKYTVSDSGFGERARWLKEGVAMSGVPVDMDIDVDIWVLEVGGQLERFRRGVREQFLLSGLPQGVEFEKISVEKDGDRIALLNTKLGMVVFCSKESGSCSQQVKASKLMEAKDIEFDGENKLMILFGGLIGVLN